MSTLQKDHNEMIIKSISENPEILWDKEWRMNNLYWITTKDGTKEVFKMNRAQKHMFDNYINVKSPWLRHIILKSRQLGFTTFIDLYILDEILFKPNREGLVIAHKVQDATEIFDRKVDFAVRNFCDELMGALFRVNRNSAKTIQVTVDDGPNKGSVSSIKVSIAGRGSTNHYLHVSEYASMCALFPKRANDLEQSTFPSVPLDGMIFIESTAEGMSGRFYEMFSKNWVNRDEITPTMSRATFMPHFYNWTWDDRELSKIGDPIPVSKMDTAEIDWAEYKKEHNLSDIEITYYYLKWMQLGNDIHKLRQEYPTTAEEAFVNSGQTYFPTTKVVSLKQKAGTGTRGELSYDEKGNVLFMPVSNGSWEIFKMPEKGVRYIAGGDTAEGLAHGDKQVLYFINHQTEDCDALYVSNVPPDELAEEAYKGGKFYNWALIAIESNKDGLWVNDALDKLGYLNLYYRKVFDDITQKATRYFGWKTTSSTRPFALAALKAIFTRKIGGFPKMLLEEMLTFVRNSKGRPEAMANKHDDVLMAAAIGYAVLQEQGKQIQEQVSNDSGSLMKTIFGEI